MMSWAVALLPLAVAAEEACLAAGEGAWVASTLAPVVLQPSFLKNWGQSVFYWGQCERPADAVRWEPEGRACGGVGALARNASLGAQFCEAFRGASVLLVGDSVQGELFSTLAFLLGPPTRGVQDEAEVAAKCLPGSKLLAHHAHEVRVSSKVCGGTVGLKFVRNEFALWDGARSRLEAEGATKWLDRQYLCEWADDVADADLLVLSRGLHPAPDAAFESQLEETLSGVVAARAAPRPPWVVLRGSHAVIPRCADYADPSPVSLAEKITATPGVAFSAQWANISHQNDIARRVARAHGVPYVDVFTQTAFRPGARPNWHDGECMHFCIPGPVDDWARLLLASWIVERRRLWPPP